jgi:RNA polymerase sigma-70 factor (sigma-E family)
MRAREERAFREFVEVRMAGLRRSAYLLCGDPHAADDLVSVTLAKLLRHWRRVAGLAHPDSYLRRMLVTAYLDERRRPWRREQATDPLPEPPPVSPTDVVDRVTLLGLLDRLPPRRRAVLVLRFFDDLSVEQTAEALGCAAGTVKALTHQGLSDLRAMLGEPGQALNAVSNLDLTTKEEP